MPVWRNPAAWFALAALAIPIAVHLLARTRAQVVAFPSLRFINISRLAARKRRRLTDLALLALRLLALMLAIAACADPLFLTASRRAAWGSRVSRAIVIDTSASMSRVPQTADNAARAAEHESRDSGTLSTVLRATSLRDGVARAVAWLRTSPPSRREVVIVSDFQIGTIDATLLRAVPDDIGVRFTRVVQTAAATSPSVSKELVADTRMVSTRGAGGAGLAWKHASVRVTEDATAVAAAPGDASTPAQASGAGSQARGAAVAPISITPSDAGFTVAPFGLSVVLPSADRARALAIMQAVLVEGVPAPAQANRPVSLLLASDTAPISSPQPSQPALPPPLAQVSKPWMADVLYRIASDRALGDIITTSGAATSNADALVLSARVSAESPVTPFLFRAVLTALAEPDTIAEAEVRAIPDSALSTWTRPAAEPTMESLRQVDESDRRWFWGAALVMLLAEMWLRRERSRASTRDHHHGHGDDDPKPKEAHGHAA